MSLQTRLTDFTPDQAPYKIRVNGVYRTIAKYRMNGVDRTVASFRLNGSNLT